MDPTIANQLTGLLQQMLQVLQAAGGGQPGAVPPGAPPAPGAPPGAAPPPHGAPPAGGAAPPPGAPPAPGAAPPPANATGQGGHVPPGGDDWDDDDGDEDGPPPAGASKAAPQGGGQGMPPGAAGGKAGSDQPPSSKGGGSDVGALHDRVDSLERHTGLKKSADVVPLVERINVLEKHWLGETFEGTPIERVDQLERVLGKSAAIEPVEAEAAETDDTAPEEIRLDDLIKSAVAGALSQVKTEFQSMLDDRLKTVQQTIAAPEDDDFPSPDQLRKQASQAQFGQRKGQQTTVSNDEDLVKSAQVWGFEEGTLDQPVTLGDLLAFQYHAARAGIDTPLSIDDEDSAIDAVPD